MIKNVENKELVETLNLCAKNTLIENLGIEIIDFENGYITARMPVDSRTLQPGKTLHGGASAAFAETIGGLGGQLYIDPDKQYCVGLDININHIRPATSGYVYGEGYPVHKGRSTHVWIINIRNEQRKLVAVSRLTLAILDK